MKKIQSKLWRIQEKSIIKSYIMHEREPYQIAQFFHIINCFTKQLYAQIERNRTLSTNANIQVRTDKY